MKHSTLRRIILSGIALSLLPFSAACSSANSSESRRAPVPKLILDGTVDDSVTEHEYLDFYTITSSTVEDISGYAVALKANAKPSKITIPAKWPNTDSGTPVVGVMPYGFREATATSLEFKGEIEIIDYEAFFGSAITSVNIPWSIKKIGDSAFYNCGSLQTVTFNSTNKTSEGSATSCPTCEEGEGGCEVDPGTDVTDALKCELTNIPAFCFFNCRSLTTLTLPASLEEIEYEAFNGCSSLASTLFFQNIKTIRARAFQSCTALRTIYIPNSFFSYLNGPGIEPLAFNLCDSELTFNFSTSEETYNTWKNSNHSEWGWRNETGSTKEYYQPYIAGDADVYFDTDWQYKVDADGATITAYNGASLTNGFLVCPNELGGETVRRIDRMAFDSVKSQLQRVYLPTTLYAIENEMFGTNYPNLIVVDSNDHCNLDWDSEHETSVASPRKRIDLSHLVDLQFIGYWAFCKMSHRTEIELLHLPANLIAIGNEAFCRFGVNNQGHMDGVKEFLWDFDESSARLQVVGTDAFYKLGVAGNNNQTYTNGKYNSKIQPATIVFPKSFKYFGMLQSDVNEYKVKRTANGTGVFAHIAFEFKLKPDNNVKAERPAHCFANCPLIGTVVFKGSAQDADKNAIDTTTSDLVIPNQTFIYNENLQRIIFEERIGHFISFHTQAGVWGQQCIGSNGVVGNDFRGRPFLQTIVLPTKYTNLRIQKLAFQGNPRAAMYLSGSYGNTGRVETSGMYYDDYDNGNNAWTAGVFNQLTDINGAEQWDTIGNEDWYVGKSGGSQYFGYCFAPEASKKYDGADKNIFFLDQKIPHYENVHYKARFSVKAYVVEGGVGKDKISNIDVEVGEKTASSLEYVEDNDCVYLCGGTDTVSGTSVNKAIMTKYLYRLWPNGDDESQINNRNIETVTVKKNLTVGGVEYTVTEIGDSAFSACYCNGKLKDDARNADNQGAMNDLKYLKLPNTIKRIGAYAFIRAYNLQSVSAYESDPASSTNYNMPSNLEYVGKNAFSFCGIKQVLNIPDNCLFYENSIADYKTTSVFTNSFSLRKITFKHGNASDSAESNKYITSTYKEGNNVYTTALYSKDDTPYNKKRLLIILNRSKGTHNYKHDPDSADVINGLPYFDTPSKIDSPIQDFVKKTGTDSYPTFEVPSAYAANPFLYGAYKMAYWIKYVDIGLCTTSTGSATDDRSKILNQPIFSGICSRNALDNATLNQLFLGKVAQQYPNVASDLIKASGEMFSMPLYGFNGCEALEEIKLPYESGGVLPEGLFANTGNVKYTTESYTTADGNLVLTGTGYSGVGKETFLNNKGITSVTTPGSGAFTIGASAFSGCTNITSVTIPSGTTNITFNTNSFYGCSKLATLDLSGVSGTVTFNEGCFQKSNITTITWPTDANAKIYIKKNAFNDCNSLVNLTLPANTWELGDGCFQSCDNLERVSFAGEDSNLASIGSSAFKECGKLNSFDFGNLTNLNEIKSSAFASAGTIVTGGIISFGSKITKFGASAFSGSGLVEVTFECSTINLGESAFASIETLTKVRFKNHACAWAAYNGSVFKNCSALTDLQLPKGFSLTTTGAADMILGDSNVRLFTYTTFNSQSPTGDWRKFDSTAGTQKDVVYFVSTLADLSAATAGGDTLFWTEVNGDAIYLGTLVSKDASLAVFSEGYQADSSGVTPTA